MKIWAKRWGRIITGTACLAFLILSTGVVHGDDLADLKALLDAQRQQFEQQKKQIEALERRLSEVGGAPRAGEGDKKKDDDKKDDKKDDKDDKDDKDKKETAKVNRIVEDYLREHPGAGMPVGVQLGWEAGFVMSSTYNPNYTNWTDGSAIPFSMRINGRIQNDWWYYHVADSVNHLTGLPTGSAFPNKGSPGGVGFAQGPASGDYNQLGVNRGRLWFQGTVFDPNLRYAIVLDGTTRGLTTINGGGLPANGAVAPGGVPTVQGGNGLGLTDHAVRLFMGYAAYDFHPAWGSRGCATCPDGINQYSPTFTVMAGKVQPFFCLEEILGSGSQQFVSFSMSDWYFDADDNNMQMGVGFQYRGMQDRLFMQGLLTNGNETQIANLQMDNYFGYQLGGWYDFGGWYNYQTRNLELFGNSISDIEWSCRPVLRVGCAANLVPMGSRSVYGNAEMNRIRISPGGPGGTSIIGTIGGAGVATAASGNTPGVDPFALNSVDSYTYDFFAAFKYHGLSIYNEWWMRNLENFRGMRSINPGGVPTPNNTGFENPVVYTAPFPGPNGAPVTDRTADALFPHKTVTDFGTTVQAGYFVIPYKLELAGRLSTIWAQSGDLYGNQTFTKTNLLQTDATGKQVPLPVRVYNETFTHFRAVNEYAGGVNWYIRGNLLKFQTDCSWYQGGNPASGGQSPSGFIPGVDGWMIRSQLQIQF